MSRRFASVFDTAREMITVHHFEEQCASAWEDLGKEAGEVKSEIKEFLPKLYQALSFMQKELDEDVEEFGLFSFGQGESQDLIRDFAKFFDEVNNRIKELSHGLTDAQKKEMGNFLFEYEKASMTFMKTAFGEKEGGVYLKKLQEKIKTDINDIRKSLGVSKMSLLLSRALSSLESVLPSKSKVNQDDRREGEHDEFHGK